jgi:hypothetical protein
VDAALALGDGPAMEALSGWAEELAPARRAPLMIAGRARLLGAASQRRGDEAAARQCEQDAIDGLRAIGARPALAWALVDRARRSGDREALEEARAASSVPFGGSTKSRTLPEQRSDGRRPRVPRS